MPSKLLICSGVLTELSDPELALFGAYDTAIISMSRLKGCESILDMAIRIFDEILGREWNEFYLIGFDVSGMAMLQLVLLLNGRDDMNCLGLIVFGTSASRPQGTILQSVESDSQMLSSLLEFDISDQLHLIRSPVVWVHGVKDQMILVSESRAVEGIPDSCLYRLDTGHSIIKDSPTEFIEIINKHIK